MGIAEKGDELRKGTHICSLGVFEEIESRIEALESKSEIEKRYRVSIYEEKQRIKREEKQTKLLETIAHWIETVAEELKQIRLLLKER